MREERIALHQSSAYGISYTIFLSCGLKLILSKFLKTLASAMFFLSSMPFLMLFLLPQMAYRSASLLGEFLPSSNVISWLQSSLVSLDSISFPPNKLRAV